jgi:hypothetical protein
VRGRGGRGAELGAVGQGCAGEAAAHSPGAGGHYGDQRERGLSDRRGAAGQGRRQAGAREAAGAGRGRESDKSDQHRDGQKAAGATTSPRVYNTYLALRLSATGLRVASTPSATTNRMRLGGPGLAERISHQSPAASTTTMRVKTIWDGVALPTRPTMSFFHQICPGGIGPGRMRGVRLAPVLVRGGIRCMRSCHRRGMSRNPAGTVASSASVTSTGSSLLLRMHRDTSCRRPGSSTRRSPTQSKRQPC